MPAGARRVLLAALSFGAIVVSVLQTLVVPITGDIATQLGASTAAVGWVVTSTLLAAAVATPLLGRLGDLYGPRRVLLAVFVAIAASSFVAAVTSDLVVLIAARVVQGTSFAVFPLAMAVLRTSLPPARRNSAMALVSGMLAAGGGVGLVVTGLLMRDGGDYHRVFWAALAVSVVALALVYVAVPKTAVTRDARIDFVGAGVLGLSLVLLLLPLSQGSTWGWTSPLTLGSFAGAVVVGGLWVIHQRRHPRPLVDMSMLARRNVFITHLVGLVIGMTMFVSFLGISKLVVVPTGHGYGFGASVLVASVIFLLPGTIAGTFAAQLGGRLVNRLGGKPVLVVAAALDGLGMLWLSTEHDQAWQVVLGAIAINAAISFGYAALPALLAEEVPASQTGIANSVNSIARCVGSSTASALVVTILASMTDPHTGVPIESSFVLVFAIGAAACAVASLAALFGLDGRNSRRDRSRLIAAGGPVAATDSP